MWAPRLPWIAVVFVFTGCEDATPRGIETLAYDSAGVRIVYSARPFWDESERWRLDPVPEVTIGREDGAAEDLLFRVTDAVRLGDGRFVVANAGSRELRFYDSRGQYLGGAGGPGDGPGEFTQLSKLEVIEEDSIVVSDQLAQRISIFDPSGRFVRSFSTYLTDAETRSGLVGVFAGGPFLLAELGRIFASDERRGRILESGVYHAADRAGALLHPVGSFSTFEAYMPPRDTGIIVMMLPFGLSATRAVAGDELFYGLGARYEIEVYSSDGRLRRLIRREHDPMPVTEDDIERVVRQSVENTASEADHPRIVRLYRNVSYPQTMPAHGAMRIDTEGNLWVAEYRSPYSRPRENGTTEWAVFDPEGGWLGAVEVPEDLTIFRIGEDWILGSRTDELGVERVELRRLLKGP